MCPDWCIFLELNITQRKMLSPAIRLSPAHSHPHRLHRAKLLLSGLWFMGVVTQAVPEYYRVLYIYLL
jgi:hypothetical protein